MNWQGCGGWTAGSLGGYSTPPRLPCQLLQTVLPASIHRRARGGTVSFPAGFREAWMHVGPRPRARHLPFHHFCTACRCMAPVCSPMPSVMDCSSSQESTRSTSATAHRPQREPECKEILDGPALTRQARRHGRRRYGLLSPSISSAASQRMSKEARTTVSRCVEAIRCREVFALPRNDPRLSAAIVGSDTHPNKRAVARLRFGCRRAQRESSTRCLAWHYLLGCVAW